MNNPNDWLKGYESGLSPDQFRQLYQNEWIPPAVADYDQLPSFVFDNSQTPSVAESVKQMSQLVQEKLREFPEEARGSVNYRLLELVQQLADDAVALFSEETISEDEVVD